MDEETKKKLKKIFLSINKTLKQDKEFAITNYMESSLINQLTNKIILNYLIDYEKKLPSNCRKIINIYETIGEYLLKKNKPKQAILYFKQALQACKNKTTLHQQNQLYYQRVLQRLGMLADVIIHDFNASIANIESAINLLKEKKILAEDFEYRAIIDESINNLKQRLILVGKYGHAGISKKAPQSINVHQVILKAKNNLEDKIESLDASIRSEKLPRVFAHFTPIRELFEELISNALKFKKANQPIQIHIRSIPQSQSSIFHQFAICDNGIGIEKRHYERIFLPFRQIKVQQNHGIGLAICRKIVKGYGGKIWVESQFGRGSCFYFTLPKSKEY